jgi:hypothetical protein
VVAWPLPELDAGADDGELRPPDDEEVPDDEAELDDEELPEEPDFLVTLDEPDPAADVT